tara:strand:- start:1387 stop:1989 length:603 start_codon:yes stop_codon:yes gene_type:complete
MKKKRLFNPKRGINASEEYGCVFIHVPKAAGNSVKSIFKIKSHAHRPVSEHEPELLEENYVFSFVRNPWDRFVSAYFFLRGGGMGWYDKESKKKYIDKFSSFDDFVKNSNYDDLMKNQIHFRPQCYYLDGPVDFLGRYEDLQSGIDTICDQLEIPRQQLPHKNKSNHKDYTKYYNDETRKIVAEKYADDIREFGYKFGGG